MAGKPGLQKSRVLTKEELDHLHQVFVSSSLQWNDMPGFACDAPIDLKIKEKLVAEGNYDEFYG